VVDPTDPVRGRSVVGVAGEGEIALVSCTSDGL
jgi:hypothetical protein